MAANGLTSSMQRYLQILNEIDPGRRGIRSVEVARAMQVSRSSVHTMMEKLSQSGYIIKEHYGIIYLTEKGAEAAED